MAGQVSGKAFDVEVSREAGYWVAVVRGLRGGATETRRLDALDVEVRDLVSGMLDLDPDAVTLHWHYDKALPAKAIRAMRHWTELRAKRDQVLADYERAQKELVAALDDAKVSLRDAAKLTGLSHQRMQQVRHQRVAQTTRQARTGRYVAPAAASKNRTRSAASSLSAAQRSE